jgi:hypothetical protein
MGKLYVDEETKPKSIIIDGELHNRFKVFCKSKSMKIGGVIEDLIRLYLIYPKETQQMIDKIKDEEAVKSLRTQMIEATKK